MWKQCIIFPLYHHIRLVWKIGDMCWSFRSSGNSRVTVEALLWASIIWYGPIYHGTSFLAPPFSWVRFCVDKYMESLAAYMLLSWHFLLAWNTWTTWWSIIILCAFIRFHWACWVNHNTPLNGVSMLTGKSILSIWLWFSSKGVNPARALMLLFRATSTIGHFLPSPSGCL